MKKTKKKNIFQKLFGLLDRKIVVPITKVVIKLSKGFKKSEKGIENWLSKSNTILFVSLFIAVVIFISLNQRIITFTSQTAEVIKDQKIEATYNKEAYVVEGLPDTVDITLMGNRSDIFIATQSTSSKVTVDLTGLKPGSHKVNIEYSQPLESINYSVNPSVATVNIYPKVSVSKTVTTDILNQDNLDRRLIVESISPELNEVVVKGTDDENATNSLKKVATVKALIDVDELSRQEEGTFTLKDVALKAYDKKGNILDVEIVPSKINVDVEISSPSKTLPIKVIPKGEIGFGKAISSINMSDSNVVVYAPKNILDTIENIPLEVNVTGLKEDHEYKLDLEKPSGVKSMSLNTVTLKFELGASTDKEINGINIDVRNLSDNYTVQGLSESDIKVDVTAVGVSSVIKNLSADDITAYIDLKNYEAGEYEVPVGVEGTDSRVQFVSKTKKVKIKIVEK
ncbi:MAG: hypothetical protein IJ093_00245 [Bacilli bacterium]|nr:hypothetical protein [Bacilli bacterium]